MVHVTVGLLSVQSIQYRSMLEMKVSEAARNKLNCKKLATAIPI